MALIALAVMFAGSIALALFFARKIDDEATMALVEVEDTEEAWD